MRKGSKHRPEVLAKFLTRTLEERFWEKVSKNGPHILKTSCWTWIGSLTTNGYGQLWYNRTNHNAQRISYKLHKGELKPGMVIMHLCDNKTCVNPAHLEQVTQDENVADCVRKGRTAKGRTRWVTEEVRKQMVEMIAAGVRQVDIRDRLGVSMRTIQKWMKRTDTEVRSHNPGCRCAAHGLVRRASA